MSWPRKSPTVVAFEQWARQKDHRRELTYDEFVDFQRAVYEYAYELASKSVTPRISMLSLIGKLPVPGVDLIVDAAEHGVSQLMHGIELPGNLRKNSFGGAITTLKDRLESAIGGRDENVFILRKPPYKLQYAQEALRLLRIVPPVFDTGRRAV